MMYINPIYQCLLKFEYQKSNNTKISYSKKLFIPIYIVKFYIDTLPPKKTKQSMVFVQFLKLKKENNAFYASSQTKKTQISWHFLPKTAPFLRPLPSQGHCAGGGRLRGDHARGAEEVDPGGGAGDEERQVRGWHGDGDDRGMGDGFDFCIFLLVSRFFCCFSLAFYSLVG